MARSVLAVALGFVLIGALATGADVLLRSLHPAAFDAAGRTEATSVLLLVMPYAWVGGRLRELEVARTPQARSLRCPEICRLWIDPYLMA